MSDFFEEDAMVLAHRGDSANYPENTMPAFESAVNMGVDVIETDVHITADKEVLIWHDDSFKRMSGDDRHICELTWPEIQKINAGYEFTNDNGLTYPYRDNPIPPVRFEDLLAGFPEMRLNVDLKDKNPELVKIYSELIKKYKSEKRVITASFHSSNLRYFRKLCPTAYSSCSSLEVLGLIILYRVGLLFLPLPFKKKILQVPEYSGVLQILSKGFIRTLHKRKAIAQVWTVNRKEEMSRFLHMGVDGIFTDKPALLMECLKNQKNS